MEDRRSRHRATEKERRQRMNETLNRLRRLLKVGPRTEHAIVLELAWQRLSDQNSKPSPAALHKADQGGDENENQNLDEASASPAFTTNGLKSANVQPVGAGPPGRACLACGQPPCLQREAAALRARNAFLEAQAAKAEDNCRVLREHLLVDRHRVTEQNLQIQRLEQELSHARASARADHSPASAGTQQAWSPTYSQAASSPSSDVHSRNSEAPTLPIPQQTATYSAMTMEAMDDLLPDLGFQASRPSFAQSPAMNIPTTSPSSHESPPMATESALAPSAQWSPPSDRMDMSEDRSHEQLDGPSTVAVSTDEPPMPTLNALSTSSPIAASFSARLVPHTWDEALTASLDMSEDPIVALDGDFGDILADLYRTMEASEPAPSSKPAPISLSSDLSSALNASSVHQATTLLANMLGERRMKRSGLPTFTYASSTLGPELLSNRLLNTSLGVILITPNYDTIYCNELVLKVFGVTDMTGLERFKTCRYNVTEDKKKLMPYMSDLVVGKSVFVQAEIRVRRVDDGLVWVRETVFCVSSRRGPDLDLSEKALCIILEPCVPPPGNKPRYLSN
ncbi:uncharacterized protein MONBRDRAFT_25129 [Monosiga brevicollis MX1]|uniref:BHLH domain-containing protein n=1 Tax=Monosiga brevicollis TaxID=81824 RepID=A9UYH8_MONBE|nr:uncharacterized protein MONBRDRAFT_25129 [Monosiga brevicollis MX1]EDQ89464.1 predicted protein [Monosiga brevicollis MX1]|eukprot:XP_001745493.1 hypothetical protein [Monosiga brevicollis MX1]